METSVFLTGTALTGTTLVQTNTMFGGYTGGMQVAVIDSSGTILYLSRPRRWGVDGKAFGPGRRNVQWGLGDDTENVPQSVADQAKALVIANYWDPKVNIVAVVIAVGKAIWEAFLSESNSGVSIRPMPEETQLQLASRR